MPLRRRVLHISPEPLSPSFINPITWWNTFSWSSLLTTILRKLLFASNDLDLILSRLLEKDQNELFLRTTCFTGRGLVLKEDVSHGSLATSPSSSYPGVPWCLRRVQKINSRFQITSLTSCNGVSVSNHKVWWMNDRNGQVQIPKIIDRNLMDE